MKKDEVKKHFDLTAYKYDYWKKKNSYYYTTLKTLYSSLIPPNKRVLEIGCGTGDILAYVNPKRGVGIDISAEMLHIASKKHPNFIFIKGSGETINLEEKFDYIIMCDLIEHLQDIGAVLRRIKSVCHSNSNLIISHANPFWEPMLMLAEKLGLKMPEGPHKRLDLRDIINYLELTGFQIKMKGHRLLIPKKIPFFSDFINSIAAKLSIFHRISFVHFIVAKPLLSKS